MVFEDQQLVRDSEEQEKDDDNEVVKSKDYTMYTDGK